MIASAADLLARLPGRVSDKWPEGERFAAALSHGSMSVEAYAPRGADPQTPHDQDELYFPISGRATLRIGTELFDAHAGTALYVPAGVEHRFERFTEDLGTWGVFWGPKGGESSARLKPFVAAR